jgi:RHS repeat-associated protein
VTASLVYDPFGRRTSATFGSAQTRYLYDYDTPVQEQNASHSPTANLVLGLTPDQRFGTIDTSGNVRSFLTDAIGSTIALADGAGTVQTSYTYEPFGKATVTGAAGTSYQYIGRDNDSTTALQFNRARYYDASKGRFISEDPLGFGGGSVNLYAYAGNSPLNAIDASGLAGEGVLPIGSPTAIGGSFGAGAVAGFVGRKFAHWSQTRGENDSTWPAPHPTSTTGPDTSEAPSITPPPCPPDDEPCLTQWGWTGSPAWRAAVREISEPGDHPTVQGKIPTYEEAVRLIRAAGGKIDRVEEAHPADGVSTHTYPHINYTTADGLKATVQIQSVPVP